MRETTVTVWRQGATIRRLRCRDASATVVTHRGRLLGIAAFSGTRHGNVLPRCHRVAVSKFFARSFLQEFQLLSFVHILTLKILQMATKILVTLSLRRLLLRSALRKPGLLT